MTPIEGIQIEKNANGQDAFIRIDLKKYEKELQPFLREVGLVDDGFEKDWEKGLTIDEAKEKSIAKIKTWWKE